MNMKMKILKNIKNGNEREKKGLHLLISKLTKKATAIKAV